MGKKRLLSQRKPFIFKQGLWLFLIVLQTQASHIGTFNDLEASLNSISALCVGKKSNFPI